MKFLRKNVKTSENIILAGDFNNTLSKKDKTSEQNLKCESQIELQSLLQEFDLEDTWRVENSNEYIFTHEHLVNNSHARIDRAYLSTKIRAEIKIKHELISFSDHYNAVFITREKEKLERGKGYWMLNNSLLEDQNYTKEIENLWVNWRTHIPLFDTMENGGKKEKNKFKSLQKLTVGVKLLNKTKEKTVLKKD